jgi:hypothetical protein
MKTLLRHRKTGLYFQGLHKWTNDPGVAVNFRFMDRALRFIETWQLKEVELVFAFEGDQMPIEHLSVSEATLQCAAATVQHSQTS